MNFCPPNDALPNDNGGWCNTPRPHFDMAQPAWEKIGVYKGGIIPHVPKVYMCFLPVQKLVQSHRSHITSTFSMPLPWTFGQTFVSKLQF
uniref:Expansin n=1 Tax=Aegilops tauschii subsp. strangulata TaxID=200361 RepID=A0A452ZQ16_AEGTS